MSQPRPSSRLSPALVVAVLCLVVASGGVGFAAGQVTSAQIKDGTIVSRDVRDGALTGADVRDRSLPRTKLSPACAAGEIRVSGGCVTKATSPDRVPFTNATSTCARRNGRLPSIGELMWLQTQPGFQFGTDDYPGDYEFTGDYIAARDEPATPVGLRRGSYDTVPNASAQYFHFHCVTS